MSGAVSAERLIQEKNPAEEMVGFSFYTSMDHGHAAQGYQKDIPGKVIRIHHAKPPVPIGTSTASAPLYLHASLRSYCGRRGYKC
jgi:hypothetical protein